MPTDSNGNYSLPASYLVQSGDDVLPEQHNPPLEDVAAGLTNRVHRDGRTVWTGDMQAGGYKLTGLADGSAAQDAATFDQTGYLKKVPESVKTDSYTVATADAGAMLVANKATALTFTLPMIASAAGTSYFIRNIGAGTLTLDGNGTETIEGATTYLLYTGQAVLLWANGTSWRVFLSGDELPGIIKEYAGSTLPFGYLWANGAAISRASYAALFAVIGTTYGAGDGSTTFNVPDRCGRVGAGNDSMGGIASKNRLTGLSGGVNGDTLGATGGAETHTLTIAQMPLHGHPYRGDTSTGATSDATGGFMVADNVTVTYPANTSAPSDADGDQIGGAGGGDAHNNVQPTIVLNYIIKT